MGAVRSREPSSASAANKVIPCACAQAISLARLIFGLGIRHVGEVNAAILANHYQSWGAFEAAVSVAAEGNEQFDDLLSIDGVGHVLVNSLIATFSSPKEKEAIQRLVGLLDIQDVEPKETYDTEVSGLTVVFTGTLEKMTRAEAKVQAESNGAKVSGSVSSKTDLLIAGPGAGSKAKKAESLGVKIIDEDTWLKMINFE